MPADIIMEIDMDSFGRDIQRLAAAQRRTCGDVLRQQCRLIIKDLIHSTPPHGNRPLTESYNFQRHKGEATVDRDIFRLYQPLTSIRAVIEPAPRGKDSQKPSRLEFLKHLAQRGKWQELSEALFDMHVTESGRVQIQETLTVDEYRETWNLFRKKGTGTVSAKNARKHLVWESSALELVRKEIKTRVGWAKAGWMAGAKALEVHVPNWIASHPAPGAVQIEDHGDSFSITLINSVSYIAYLNAGNRLLNRVLANRERAMEISLEHAIDHIVEEWNA